MTELSTAAIAGLRGEGLDLVPVLWSSDTLIVVVVDPAGRVVAANARFEQLAGKDPRGQLLTAFVSQGQVEAFSAWVAASDGDWRTRVWGLLPDVDLLPRDVRVTVRRGGDGGLVVVGEPAAGPDLEAARASVNDVLVDEQRRLARDGERLDRAASQDGLTGLLNRRAFDARLVDAVELAAAGSGFAVVMLDVDHFKAVNDTYGHPTGDAVLRWLARLLGDAARKADVVARYGGEEFIAILPGADQVGATNWANRLRRSVGAEPPAEGAGAVTISLGVAVWASGESGPDVVARADRALYAAKVGGRDRVVTDGLDEPPIDEGSTELPAPFWQASAIGIAIVEDATVRSVNGALERLLGRNPADAAVGGIVHPDQTAAFTDYIRAAARDWRRGTFGFASNERGTPLDHVTWARRRGGRVELVVEPAVGEHGRVQESLLALVDDLIEVQRELQEHAGKLERALEDKTTAERYAASLERLLPVCAWCGRIKLDEDEAGHAWVAIEAYLDRRGIGVTHSLCETCAASMDESGAADPRASALQGQPGR